MELLFKMLAKDPEQRYYASELLEEPVLSGKPRVKTLKTKTREEELATIFNSNLTDAS